MAVWAILLAYCFIFYDIVQYYIMKINLRRAKTAISLWEYRFKEVKLWGCDGHIQLYTILAVLSVLLIGVEWGELCRIWMKIKEIGKYLRVFEGMLRF